MLLLDNVVLDINPNKHAAIIKTITLNTFKTVYFNSAACSVITRKYVVLTRKDLVITRKYVVLTRKDLVITRKYGVLTRKDLVITRKYVVLTRKDLAITRKYGVLTRKDVLLTRKIICRFNQKRSRYYEKICRFNEKRSRYNDIIEWKKYYVWAVLCHRNFTLKIFDMDTIGTNHMLLLKLYWQSKKRLEKVLLINVCK